MITTAQRDGEHERHHLGEPRDRQRGEQHHRALREVEHARRLEDQHETKRHQRVGARPGEQTADQGFEERAEHACPLAPLAR